ncbi:hypothetical protein TEA_016271 [Camellia sinensis var. sinensis]|uniref:Fungal lipase-like domain-containing protein n=1 Tax=Camellia sinensis var. sinensis TaxID=542762 RepID=A0A4S4EWB6_CAMSN|nr:hypothetical protein TEA_016271 [Camellia sinensis var. sinensis]
MSVACGVEWVLALGFLRWGWKRCTYIGSYDSATWPPATAEEFEAVPRICRVTLAVYEGDLRHPQFPPAGGYRLNPDCVIKRLTYEQTHGNAPPYIIYLDHDHREIVLAIRGLNLIKESDYKLLLDNKLGMQMFDGGYVHHGLLKSAVWLLNEESDTLKRLWLENGASYKMIFAGHSLGSGVAALLTVIVALMLWTACPAYYLRFAGGILSYQKAGSLKILEDCMHPEECIILLRENFAVILAQKLSPPLVHAHRCGRYPPEVRTAIPVDGRFEHIVLSCNATKDHAIVWIEREAEKALELSRPPLLCGEPYRHHLTTTMSTSEPVQAAHLYSSIPVAMHDPIGTISVPRLSWRHIDHETAPLRYESWDREVDLIPSLVKKSWPPVGTSLRIFSQAQRAHSVAPVVCKLGTCTYPSSRTPVLIPCYTVLGRTQPQKLTIKRMPEYHKETTTAAPRVQKIERLQTIEKEHKDALERAVSLNIPHAVTADEEEEQPSPSKEEECVEGGDGDDTESSTNEPKTKSLSRGGRTNWDLVVQKLFKKYPLGEMLLKKDDTVVELNHKS